MKIFNCSRNYLSNRDPRKTLHNNVFSHIEKYLSIISVNSEIFSEDSKTDAFYFGDDLKIILSINKYRETTSPKCIIDHLKNFIFKNKTFDSIANRWGSMMNWKNLIFLKLFRRIKAFKNLPYKNFTTEEIVDYPNLNICKVIFKERKIYGFKIKFIEKHFKDKNFDNNKDMNELNILNPKEKILSDIENNYSKNNANTENNIEESNNCSKRKKCEEFINKTTIKKDNIYLNSQFENKKKHISIFLPMKNIKLQTKPIIKIDEQKKIFNNFELKSYRVNYDLTTNFRNIDFKFKNDRDFSLLIQNKYGFSLNEILKCNIPEKALEN